jgi:hypothetical protein
MLYADGIAPNVKNGQGYSFLRINSDGVLGLASPVSERDWKNLVKNQDAFDYGRMSSVKVLDLYGKK